MSNEQLIQRLKSDHAQTRREIRVVRDRRRQLSGKLRYIETLLKSGGAQPDVLPDGESTDSPERETISTTAARILMAAGRPMSATELAQAAISEGKVADNLDRARSRIAATVSRDHKRPDATFTHLGRGEIGLVAWRDSEVQ